MRAYVTILGGDDALLPYFIKHYLRLGATTFPVLIFGTETEMDRAVKTIRGLGGEATSLDVFPLAAYSAAKRDSYIRRAHSDGEWAFFCDLDEFVETSAGELERYIRAGVPYVGGRWLDRVAAGGKLNDVSPVIPLEDQFPFGATTRRVWKMPDNCFVLSPRAPTIHHPRSCAWGKKSWSEVPKLVVHHFRWQANIVRRLEQRLARLMATGEGKPGWAACLRRTLGHVERFGGINPRLLHHVGSVLGI